MVKIGQTIVSERERIESESERMQARKKAKNKKIISVLTVISIGLILVLVVALNFQNFFREVASDKEPEVYEPTVEIIDEDRAGVTKRMKDYVGRIERDFADLGFSVTRAVIPTGKTREIDVYLSGREGYIKLNLDRGTAVSAEDAARMIRYLDSIESGFSYVDVRVEGKGYYK